jgi:signal transduction histidine kinase
VGLVAAANDQSIVRKLTRASLLVSTVALLLSCALFIVYDQITYRSALTSHIAIQGQVISASAAAALRDHDRASAENTLAGLRGSPHIVHAEIYTADGQPFAAYWRDTPQAVLPEPVLPRGQSTWYWFGTESFHLVQVIVADGQTLGTVYIQNDLDSMYARLKTYALMVAGLLLICLLVTSFLSRMLQRAVLRPILSLAETASRVAEEKNYSLRATATPDGDEVAGLAGTFNQMLEHIEERDAALQQARDALERRVVERTTELANAEVSLRRLSGELMNLQDEERRRIARELHDSSGQIIAALGLNLATLQTEERNLSSHAAMALAESLELTRQFSRELRTISHLLHPPLLDESGLDSALRWYVEGFAQRSNISVNLQIAAGLGRLSKELEIAVFRIVQECLTNVHRHSGSDRASIQVSRDDRNVTVQVRDYGHGMSAGNGKDSSSRQMRPGVGMMGMQERVRQLGGRLDVRSDSQGTLVVAVMEVEPLKSQQSSVLVN